MQTPARHDIVDVGNTCLQHLQRYVPVGMVPPATGADSQLEEETVVIADAASTLSMPLDALEIPASDILKYNNFER